MIVTKKAANPVLCVENLVIRSGATGVNLVRGVTFEVAAGEIVGIAGESGSGKSLTARAIMRLEPAGVGLADGRLEVCGTDMVHASRQVIQGLRGKVVSMILQDPSNSLNPTMRILRQVGEPLRLHRDLTGSELRQEVQRLLSNVGIDNSGSRMSDYPHMLSGGMCQRVVGAIAVAAVPRLIIADEPTTALDVTIQAEFLSLLLELRRTTGVSILFISHDLGLMESVADRVIVMKGGSIVEEGPTLQLFRDPRHPYTRELLEAHRFLRTGIMT